MPEKFLLPSLKVGNFISLVVRYADILDIISGRKTVLKIPFYPEFSSLNFIVFYVPALVIPDIVHPFCICRITSSSDLSCSIADTAFVSFHLSPVLLFTYHLFSFPYSLVKLLYTLES